MSTIISKEDISRRAARQSVKEPLQRAFIPKVEQAFLVLFLTIDHVCSIRESSAKDRLLRAQPLGLD